MKDQEQQKPTQEAYRVNEEALLKGLLAAAQERDQETRTIEIARKGKVFFRFRIRPLSEEEYNECREKATVYRRNRQMGGLKLPEDTNTTRYRSLLIYTATIDEDRKALWDNAQAQQQLDVLSGPDLIDKVLYAGEKQAVIEQIDLLSGFDTDIEETAKN